MASQVEKSITCFPDEENGFQFDIFTLYLLLMIKLSNASIMNIAKQEQIVDNYIIELDKNTKYF